MKNEEIWKYIEGFEGAYKVSNLGRVKSKNKVLKSSKTEGIDSVVGLSVNGVCKSHQVKKLVADAFIECIDGAKYIKHKDGDKHNNRADNLYYTNKKPFSEPQKREIGNHVSALRRLGDWGHAKGYGCYLCDCGKRFFMKDEVAQTRTGCLECDTKAKKANDKKFTDKKERQIRGVVPRMGRERSKYYREKAKPEIYTGRVYGDFKLTGNYTHEKNVISCKYEGVCTKCGYTVERSIPTYHTCNKCRKCGKVGGALHPGDMKGVYQVVERVGKQGAFTLYKFKCTVCGDEHIRTSSAMSQRGKCTCETMRLYKDGIVGAKRGVYTIIGREDVGQYYAYVLKCSVCGKVHVSSMSRPVYMNECRCEKKRNIRDFSDILEKYLDK